MKYLQLIFIILTIFTIINYGLHSQIIQQDMDLKEAVDDYVLQKCGDYKETSDFLFNLSQEFDFEYEVNE